MILCLDAGNSRIKWGLRAPQHWHAQGVCTHAALDNLPHDLPAHPTRLLACNVAGPAIATHIEALATNLGVPLDWLRSSAAAGGVRNGYDHPERLGADRWAALIGARALHAGTALVIMAGTATTIDLLGADGYFRGGLILPGLDLMPLALADHTAGLPVAQGQYRDLPTQTDDAIISGAVHATLGAIERMAHRHASADFGCLVSGGAAARLLPYLTLPLRPVDNLVLEGLARIATRDDLL